MKMKIAWKALLTLFLMIGAFIPMHASAQKMDKSAFYALMQSGTKDEIDAELAKLKDNEEGYAGALIIREAGLPKAKARLKMFKEGKAKLEAGIAADPDNAELHFIRLSIQEKSPKIVGYKGNIEADKTFVIKHFDKLPPVVQRAVKDYSKDSKVLKPTDF